MNGLSLLLTKLIKMASLFSIFDFSFSLSLGRNILFGVSIGLGIGVGIGVGMVTSKRIFPFRADDRNLVVLFSELTNLNTLLQN